MLGGTLGGRVLLHFRVQLSSLLSWSKNSKHHPRFDGRPAGSFSGSHDRIRWIVEF